jgi:hypothetical protein
MPPSKPTLTLDDVPLTRLQQQVDDLRRQAEIIGDNARKQLAAGDLQGAVARYEACLARYQIADRLGADLVRIAADLARVHAERAPQDDHPWPIPHLMNLRRTEVEHGVTTPATIAERYPQWGVYAADGEAVTIVPSERRGADLLMMIDGDGSDISLAFDAATFRSLAALAARICDGKPLPYDRDGHVRLATTDTPESPA